jgi:hypothetical protein
MAEIAAEMAGFNLHDLDDRMIERDDAKAVLYRRFVQKGFQAIDVLGPAIVQLEIEGRDKVPAEVHQEGAERGYHPLMTVRTWRGLTVEDLASKSGLSADLIRAIEGREAMANEMHDAAMAEVLSVSPHALTDYGAMPEIDRHAWLADTLAAMAA